MSAPHSRAGSYLAVAIFLATSTAVFLWLFHTAGGSLGLSPSYRVWVTLPDAFALNPGADVTAAGVRIGRVSAIRPDGQQAAIQLQLDARYAPIPRTTSVALRTKSLVGESYLDLQLGNPSLGYEPNDATLPPAAGRQSVQIDQVLNSLTPRTRRAVTDDLRSLGLAVSNRGADLNPTLANLGAISGKGGRVLSILAAQAPQVHELVSTSQQVFAALGQRQDALRGLIVDAGRAAQAAASRDRQLRQTLSALPRTLVVLHTTSTRLGMLGRTGTPVIRDLSTALHELTPAVGELPSAARAGTEFSSQLPILTAALGPILGHLGRFSAQAKPVATPLRQALAQLRPFVNYLRPYASDLGGVVATVGAGGDWFNQVGHMVAVQPLFDEQTLASLPPSAQQLVDAIMTFTRIATIGPTSTNPYPAPGAAGSPRPWTSSFPHVGGP